MPEKHILKGFVIFRKTSWRNIEKHHVPRALMWHSSGYSIFSLYILGSLSSNQPHNYMIVTRLTEWTIQKS